MDIEQHVFDDSYEDTIAALEVRLKNGTITLDDAREELKHLCIYEGQDMVGRGELKQAEISGMIMAYQAFIMRNAD